MLDNTLTWTYKYPCSNRENFPFPIQIKLSKKNKRFAVLYLNFWYLHEISNVLKKNWALEVNHFWSYWLRNMCLFKCITGLNSANPLTVNVLTSPKNFWNLQKSTLILLSDHFGLKWVSKGYFWSDLRF